MKLASATLGTNSAGVAQEAGTLNQVSSANAALCSFVQSSLAMVDEACQH
jgi:hypothetical protein